MTDLSIIIVNYNTGKLLSDCLASIFRFTHKVSFEVIVIDNGSTDDTLRQLKPFRKRLKLIRNKTNLGFAKANNQGIRLAQSAHLLLLNSDTKITDDAIGTLYEQAVSRQSAIAGPRLLNADGSPQSSTAPFYSLPVTAFSLFGGDRFLRRSPARQAKVDWLSGACFLIDRRLIDKIGLLDENFFMYIEEMEFCYRAKKAGFATWYFPEAAVLHLVRGSSPEGKQKIILWIYQGLLYFYQKHFAAPRLIMLKSLLRAKAALAWFFGYLAGNDYLIKTYGKAFWLVGQTRR